MKPFLSVVLMLLISVAIVFGYRRQQLTKHLADGEIRCIGCMTSEEKANFDKRNALEAAKIETEAKSKADNPPPSIPSAPANSSDGGQAIQTPQPETSLPESGNTASNPPNGASPGSEGTYQWFRQEKMTWRLNTKTGGSCVAFATPDEWKKPAVASHGCFRTK